MASNVEWSVGLTRAVKKLSEDVVKNTADEMHKFLSSQITSFGDNWRKNTGITPYDDFRPRGRRSDPHLYNHWSLTYREENGRITARFRNRLNHAKYVFGKEISNRPEWRRGNEMYRSAEKHSWQMFEEGTMNSAKKSGDKLEYQRQKSYKYAPKRPNQLTERKWTQFKEWGREQIKTNIKSEIKLYDGY